MILNPLAEAIHQTTGLFIDERREHMELIDKLSKLFYRNYSEYYETVAHNLLVKK